MQGDVFFNTSTGVRIVPKTVIFQYRPTYVPECTSCSCTKTPQTCQLTLKAGCPTLLAVHITIVTTIGREVIAEVNIDDLSFNLLTDEDSLWTGKLPVPAEVSSACISKS